MTLKFVGIDNAIEPFRFKKFAKQNFSLRKQEFNQKYYTKI